MVSAGFASEVVIARRCLALKLYSTQCHSNTMEKIALFFLKGNMKYTAK